MGHILVVDDEPAIVTVVRERLEREGFAVRTVASGEEALTHLSTDFPDLIVLDVLLPGMDGFEVLRRLRGTGNTVPVIVLTARDEDVDKIVGLELGADEGAAEGLRFDPSHRQAWFRGEPLALRPREFDLLHFLSRHPGQVFTREALLAHVWGHESYIDERTVDVHVRRLRGKLAAIAPEEKIILTEWGVGYRLAEDV
jgi:DNA-binding response OmpR family regulator